MCGSHEVTNAMLSNYEVLALLREQDQKRAAASRSRKGQPAPQTSKLPQNLLTVEFEVRPPALPPRMAEHERQGPNRGRWAQPPLGGVAPR